MLYNLKVCLAHPARAQLAKGSQASEGVSSAEDQVPDTWAPGKILSQTNTIPADPLMRMEEHPFGSFFQACNILGLSF